ncbi:MAG TPA: hypothetical protein PKK10_10345 [Woeseiaceae bacterium]|nr:hypothetical protein [Woeseiaceae bacterium]
MLSLLDNLKKRRIWRVLVAYPSVTFIWLQVVEFFIDNYGLDERLLTVSIIVAIVLFPAAVIINWRHGEDGAQAPSKTDVGIYSLLVAFAVGSVYWYWSTSDAPVARTAMSYEPARSIAVMPFENLSDDPGVQFLCDGIAESLINWLATIPDVKVSSKSAAFRLRDAGDDTATIAEQLGVDGVIRGRLEKVDDQIVVSTSFVDARDDNQLWGERLVRPAGEVLFLERSIVASIKDGLVLKVSDASVQSSASGGTDDPQAYLHYLRGHYLIQSTNTEDIYQGIDELRAAIQRDPQFALAQADIADALSQMISYDIGRDEAMLLEAQRAAYSAVTLAPKLAEAQTALATMLQYVDLDWDKAQQAYEAAIALAPQSPVPYHRFADFLSLTLQTERAMQMARKALAIDALDSSAMHALGIAAMMHGDFETAAQITTDWNRFHPNSRWSYVKNGLMLAFNDQCDESLVQLHKVEDLINSQPPTLMDSWMEWGYHLCGADEDLARSRARIEDALRANPTALEPGFAYHYAIEGNTKAFLALAERIVAERNPLTLYLLVFSVPHLGLPVTDDLLNNPRYAAMIENAGLQQYRPN